MKSTALLRTLTVSMVLVCGLPCLAQRHERLIDTWKPTHFDIDLTFDAKLTSIQAKTSVDVVVIKDNTSVIDLDFGTMPVTTVTVGSSSARFTQHEHRYDGRQISTQWCSSAFVCGFIHLMHSTSLRLVFVV